MRRCVNDARFNLIKQRDECTIPDVSGCRHCAVAAATINKRSNKLCPYQQENTSTSWLPLRSSQEAHRSVHSGNVTSVVLLFLYSLMRYSGFTHTAQFVNYFYDAFYAIMLFCKKYQLYVFFIDFCFCNHLVLSM